MGAPASPLPALLHWHLPGTEHGGAVPPWHQVLLISRARAALSSCTWGYKGGRGRAGVIPAGKAGGEGGCGRLEHGTHSLQGE